MNKEGGSTGLLPGPVKVLSRQSELFTQWQMMTLDWGMLWLGAGAKGLVVGLATKGLAVKKDILGKFCEG